MLLFLECLNYMDSTVLTLARLFQTQIVPNAVAQINRLCLCLCILCFDLACDNSIYKYTVLLKIKIALMFNLYL